MIVVRCEGDAFLCLQCTEISMDEFSGVSVLEHP